MNSKHSEIQIDDLALFLFKDNKNDNIIELHLEGIENTKDLFFFCFDLFCKGLVHLFGENNKVIISSLTLDQFHVIKNKMKNAGIHATLEIVTNDTNILPIKTLKCENDETVLDLPSSVLYPRVNINDLENAEDNRLLKEYIFEIHLTESLYYKISFEVIHSV